MRATASSVILLLVSVLALGACSGGQGKTDGGTDGGVIPWGACAFSYTTPGETVLEDERGEVRTCPDIHLRCRIDHQDLEAEVFVKARAVRIEHQSVFHEVTGYQLCRGGSLETRPNQEADLGDINRHAWKTMDVAVDGRLYAFSMGEMCVGARPCVPWPDQFDVYSLPDMTLVSEAVPALCAGVGDTGIPAPLVPAVRLPPEGEGVPFTMGGDGGDPDELPAHTFDVWPHRLDVREATWADFARFLSDHGNDCEGHPCVDLQGEGFRLAEQDGFWKPEVGAEELPAVHVSWQGASAYCAWRRMLLPYEATWEMAASAMGARTYPWGEETPSCDLALHDTCGATGPEAVCTRAAGMSSQGVCNLAGNVSEWMGDYYQADQYATCVEEGSCRSGPLFVEPGNRVVRGGSFTTPAHKLRARDRDFRDPGATAPDLGVRCMASNPSW